MVMPPNENFWWLDVKKKKKPTHMEEEEEEEVDVDVEAGPTTPEEREWRKDRWKVDVGFRAATYFMRVFISLMIVVFCLTMIGMQRGPLEVYWAVVGTYGGYWFKGAIKSGLAKKKQSPKQVS